jgi:hypothetical protein
MTADSSTTILVDDELWITLKRLAGIKRRGAAVVAVPYCSDGTLALKKGDTLIVDLSPGTLKSGLTNPAVLENYRKAGVDLYRSFALHAKVFVFPQEAMVGSANMSESSMTRLREAAVLVSDPVTVKEIRTAAWGFADATISAADIRDANKLYRHPRGGPRLPARPSKQDPAGPPPTAADRLWLLGVGHGGWAAPDFAEYERHRRQVARKAGKASGAKVGVILWPRVEAARLREDDLIIEVTYSKDNRPHHALCPERVVEISPVPHQGRGEVNSLIYVRTSAGSRTLPWVDLQGAARSVGGRLSDPKKFRQVKTPAVRGAIVSLWRTP